MIQVVQGFQVSTRDAVDNRILLTKAQMRAINDNQMPDVYFAVCKEDALLYIYIKNRESVSPETGKFAVYSASKIESISVNGEVLPISDMNVDLPLATAERYGLLKLGKGLTTDTDGTVTLDFNTLDDKVIPFEKLDLEGLIVNGDNISII